MFLIWFWRIGLAFGASNSFARGGSSFYGPYDLWFQRVWGPVYWAVTPPYRLTGIYWGR